MRPVDIGIKRTGRKTEAAATDLAVMEDLRRVFNPRGNCSPHKMLPTAGGCGMEQIERTGKRAAM